MGQQAREQNVKLLQRWFMVSSWTDLIGGLCDTFPVKEIGARREGEEDIVEQAFCREWEQMLRSLQAHI